MKGRGKTAKAYCDASRATPDECVRGYTSVVTTRFSCLER